MVFQIVLRFIYKRIVRLLERRSVVVLIRIDVSKIDELSFPEFIFSTIYDFTVSVTILFGGANSGQISIKSRDRADKYVFPNLFSGSNFYIYQFPEGLGMRKIAHGIRMQNNSQTRTNIFWIFTDFHGVMRIQRSSPPQGNFISGVANPEIVCCVSDNSHFKCQYFLFCY